MIGKALVALTCIATLAVAQERRPFRVNVDAVPVDVLATDRGLPLTGLGAADFELRDNGVIQRIDSVSIEDVPLNLMLALDTSQSVDGEPLAHLKEAAAAVADLLKPSDRLALLTFSDEIAVRVRWTSDGATFAQALDRTGAGGATALHDAAFTALSVRSDLPGRALVILFSDGDDTISWLPGQIVIDAARRTDAVVYAVALGKPSEGSGYRADLRSGLQLPIPNVPARLLQTGFLEDLAAETGGRLATAGAGAELKAMFQKIVREFRTRYLLTYAPQGVASSGWHQIEVRLKNRRGEVRARRGYLR